MSGSCGKLDGLDLSTIIGLVIFILMVVTVVWLGWLYVGDDVMELFADPTPVPERLIVELPHPKELGFECAGPETVLELPSPTSQAVVLVATYQVTEAGGWDMSTEPDVAILLTKIRYAWAWSENGALRYRMIVPDGTVYDLWPGCFAEVEGSLRGLPIFSRLEVTEPND